MDRGRGRPPIGIGDRAVRNLLFTIGVSLAVCACVGYLASLPRVADSLLLQVIAGISIGAGLQVFVAWLTREERRRCE